MRSLQRLVRGRPVLISASVVVVAGALVLSFALLTGVGSDSTAPETTASGPINFLERAHLPGDGWTAEEPKPLANIYESRNAFRSSVPDIDACQDLRDLELALYRTDEAFQDGAVQHFERQLAGGGFVRVSHHVVDYSASNEIDDAWALLQRIIDGHAHATCQVAAAELEGVSLTTETLQPPAVLPGSLSVATRYRGDVDDVLLEISEVIVWWRSNDSLGLLSITSTGGALPEADLEAIISGAGVGP